MDPRIVLVIGVFQLYSVQCFLFSSSSKSDSCSNLIFTCQPLCFKRSSTGCTCDCTNQANPMINPNFDPSNPSGSMVQPSDNPANPSGPYIPGSLQCSNDWMNCHSPCSPSIDFKTGCPHCQCPQSPTPSSPTMSTPSTDPTKTTPTTPSGPRRTTPTTPTGPTSTTTLITQSTSYQPSKTKSPTVSTASQSTTVIPTTAALHSVTATTSTVSSSPSTTMFPVSSTSSSLLSNTPASTTPNVVLPVVQTTPHPPTHAPTSTLAPSTTMATIACPGIFSCFKDCFTGYKSDANGCPLCECEPLPTGIPSGYSFCPQRVNCIPGCVKINERGCKECACGELMFHPGGFYGMTGMVSGGGGLGGSFPNFQPGTLAGGSPFGSIQGATHQEVKEKPLKECSGTLLCMTTCQGQYSLGAVGSNGCRSCTCPHHSTSHTTSHTVNTVSHATANVQFVQATHHSSCTGTKLCMATCHTRYTLGEKGHDGCQSCSCMPEATPAPKPVPTKTCMQTYLCMLSCKTGYTLGETGSDGCQSCTCLPPPTAAPTTPAPKPLQCEKTLNCMLSCKSGYQLGNTGPDGCPMCSCIQAVTQVIEVLEVKCPAELHCDVCCNIGYKCDSNGCPVCECIAPAAVGSTAVMVIEKPMRCPASFSCHAPCHDGYKCGEEGCPTCECLTIVTVQQVQTHHEEHCDTCGSQTIGAAVQQHVVISPSVNGQEICNECDHGTGTTHLQTGMTSSNSHASPSGTSSPFASLGTGSSSVASSGNSPFSAMGGSSPFASGNSGSSIGVSSGNSPFSASSGGSPFASAGSGSSTSSSSGNSPFTVSSFGSPFVSSGSGTSTSGSGGNSPFSASSGGSPFTSGNSGSSIGVSSGNSPFSASSGGSPFTSGNSGSSIGVSSGNSPFSVSSGGPPFASAGSGSSTSVSGGNSPFSASSGGSPFASAGSGSSTSVSSVNSPFSASGLGLPFSSTSSGSTPNASSSTALFGTSSDGSAFHATSGASLLSVLSGGSALSGSNSGSPSIINIAGLSGSLQTSGQGSGNSATTSGSLSGSGNMIESGVQTIAGGLPIATGIGGNGGGLSQTKPNGVSPFKPGSSSEAGGASAGVGAPYFLHNYEFGGSMQTGSGPNGSTFTPTSQMEGYLGQLSPNQASQSGNGNWSSGPFNAGGAGPFGNNGDGFHLSSFAQAAAGGSGGKGPFSLAMGNNTTGTGPFSSLPGGNSSPFGSSFGSVGNGLGGSALVSTGFSGGMNNVKPPPFGSSNTGSSLGGSNGVSSHGGGSGLVLGGHSPMSGGIIGHGDNSQQGSTDSQNTIENIIKNCSETIHCMTTCPLGYSFSNIESNGCPVCSCVIGHGEVMTGLPHQSKTGSEGQIEEENTEHATSTPSKGLKEGLLHDIQASTVTTCPITFTCPVTCSVGYVKGSNSCPTCECVEAKEHPPENQEISCLTKFACTKNCDSGYKRGKDGCPICDCVHEEECHHCEKPRPTPKPDQTAVVAILQKCPQTEQCMTSCKYGYHMGSAGQDGCPTCSCVEKETCHDCTESHHTIQVVQPVHVQTTSTEHCTECGTGGHQAQIVVTSHGSNGGAAAGGSTGSHGSGGVMGGGGGFSGSGAFGEGSSGGGSQCRPLTPDCHPSCIVYDVAHCRQCRCHSSPMH